MKKMNQYLFICISGIIITSCIGGTYGQIKITKDEMTNNKVITLDAYYSPTKVSPFYNSDFKYTKVIKDKADVTFTLNFSLEGDENIAKLEKTAYIKIDDKPYKLNVTDSSSDSTSTKKYEFTILKGKVLLKNDIVKKINENSIITYQFYSGAVPVVFKLTSGEVKYLVTFIKHNGK